MSFISCTAAASLAVSICPPGDSNSCSDCTLSWGATRLTFNELDPAFTTRTLISLAWQGRPGSSRQSQPGDEMEPPGSFSYLVGPGPAASWTRHLPRGLSSD